MLSCRMDVITYVIKKNKKLESRQWQGTLCVTFMEMSLM